MNSGIPANIGLVAGWGRYPAVVAEALQSQGYRVYCLAIKDHTDPVLRESCDDYHTVGLAKLGAAIRYFRRIHPSGQCRVAMTGVHAFGCFSGDLFPPIAHSIFRLFGDL